jgi:hypothetical protein
LADFKVQRGEVSFGVTDTSVTISSGGTDYDTPAAITKAFIFITACNHTGDGDSVAFGGTASRQAVYMSNPENLLTSVTFNKTDANGASKVQYEIWEYTGSAGGVNEFKVLGQETLSLASTVGTANSSAWTPADNNDVVGWITSQGTDDTSTSRGDAGITAHTSEWNGTSNYITVTRSNTGDSSKVSVAAIEFTGSNWTIQREPHSFVAADTDETEAITAVSALTEAFLHVQHRNSSTSAPDYGFKAWLSTTSEITYRVDEITGTHDAVAWVIENPDLVVQHLSGTWSSSATDPDTNDVSVTTVSALAETTVQGISATTGGSRGDLHDYLMGARLTSTSNVRLFRGISDGGRDYRFSVVQLPTAAGGAATATPGAGLVQWNGASPSVFSINSVSPLSGLFQWVGGTPRAVGVETAVPSAGLFQWNGSQPTALGVTAGVTVSPGAGEYNWTGDSPTTFSIKHTVPGSGTVQWVGSSPTTSVPRTATLTPSSGEYNWFGSSPSVEGIIPGQWNTKPRVSGNWSTEPRLVGTWITKTRQ